MNYDLTIDLQKLLSAIESDISSAIADATIVKFFYDEHNIPKTPCILLDLSEFEPANDDDPGTGQICLNGVFSAQIMMFFTDESAKFKVRQYSSQLAAFIHNRRWINPDDTSKKLPTGNAIVFGCYKDDFHGLEQNQKGEGLEQYEIWRVDWQQKIYFGSDYWDELGYSSLVDVSFNDAPNIGQGHEADYTTYPEPEIPAPNIAVTNSSTIVLE